MKDPAFLFYSSDFMMGTLTMTHEQVGKYIRLLCLQHQKGRLTEQDMKYICTTHEADVYSKFIQDEDGLYYNERLDIEINKRKKYSDSRRKNINKRYSKNKSEKSDSTYVLHMENENRDINNTSFSNKESKLKEVSKPKFDFSFIDKKDFIPLVEDFGDYRRQIKKPWKTQRAVTMFYKELIGLSMGNYEKAVSLIEYAKGKEWQTVYEITNTKHNGHNKAQEAIEALKLMK